jgi:hypothetical protein
MTLWDNFIPFNSQYIGQWTFPNGEPFVMDIKNETVSMNNASWDSCWKKVGEFLEESIGDNSTLFFFWHREQAGIIPKDILVSACEDFFYMDESCIVLVPNTDIVIYSIDDWSFYYAKVNRMGREQT